MFYLVIIVFVLYALMLVMFIAGWQKSLGSRKEIDTRTKEMITVLVPVRNEEANISALLSDLFAQQDGRFEIIVIDDHSEDSTPTLVRQAVKSSQSERVQLLALNDNVTGKKHAIELGADNAMGSIIVTIDGDCRVGPNWLDSIRRQFSDDEVKLVFGGVRIAGNGSLWCRIQAMEFFSLIGTGASTNAWGMPTMCNGANLAFRREVFHNAGGYRGNHHIPSGDDEFLMRKIAEKYPDGIQFNSDSRSVVTTTGQKTFKHFVYQRRRWAGKWKSHSSGIGAKLALTVFGFHFLLICSAIWTIWFGHFYLILAFLLLKVLPEFLFLRRVSKFLSTPWSWSAFVVLQVAHSVYVVIFGLLAQGRTYEWKGRTVNSSRYIMSTGYADNS